MDIGFVIAVVAGLCLITGLVFVRLGAAGLPTRRIAVPIIELWLTVAIWIAVLQQVSATLGQPTGGSGLAELQDLGARFAALDGATRLWIGVGLAASVALVAHLLVTLRRMMSEGVGL